MTIRLNPADLSQTRSDLGLTIGTSNGNVIAADSTGLPAINGSQVTALNASNLGSGTVPTARLGSGTASGTTFLAGDQTYKTVAAGLNHLSTATASSTAALNFTSLITSTYDVYLIMLDEILPATHAGDLRLRLSGDNGSTFSATNYAYVTDVLNKHNNGDSVVRTSTGGRGQGQIELMNGAAVNQGQGVSGSIYLFSPLNTALQVSLRWSFIGTHSDKNIKLVDGAAKEETSASRNAFSIYFHNGDIASGQVRVYGIANG